MSGRVRVRKVNFPTILRIKSTDPGDKSDVVLKFELREGVSANVHYLHSALLNLLFQKMISDIDMLHPIMLTLRRS